MIARRITEQRVYPLLCGPYRAPCLFHVHESFDQSATPVVLRRDSCENEAVCNFTEYSHKSW